MKKIQREFDKWVDEVLSGIDSDMQGYCFNMYEEENCYSIELVAFDEIDEYDADWASGGSETYASRDDDSWFLLQSDYDFEQCLEIVEKLIGEYMKHGKYVSKLKKAKKVCYGFVDGDLYDMDAE